MSLTRPFAWMIALLAVLILAPLGRAQHPTFNPFIEPDAFHPDLQFFRMPDVDEYSGRNPPNVGFYFQYSRMQVYFTRPEGTAFAITPDDRVILSDISLGSGHDGDFTWGNRFDFGYMTPENAGWAISTWHITGPNEYDNAFQERLDRRNEDDDSDGFGDGSNIEPILQDRNPRGFDLAQSLNVARFSSFELNRVWRRKQFHNGTVFEPFVGLRYMKFNDYGRRDTFDRFDEDTDNLPDITAPNGEGPYEIYTSTRSEFQNTMLGGQLGFRLSHEAGHWLLSSELRMFALQNWQFLTQRIHEINTRFDGLEGSDVELERRFQSAAYEDNSEFVWGGELRTEAAYALTRDINFHFGFVFLDLGKGIARGMINGPGNSQDVQIGGLTFGLTINR